jgi:hypothetical protein
MQHHARSSLASRRLGCASVLLATLVTGCTRGAPTREPTRLSNDEGDGTQAARHDLARGTVAQQLQGAVQACRQIQAARGIPIGCAVDSVQDVPAMVVSFARSEDAVRYDAVIAEHLAAPFCRATRAAELAAAFVVTVANQSATAFDCQTGSSKTVALNATVSPIEQAIRSCEAMSQASLPVDCRMTKVDETPALLLAFGTVALLNEYLGRTEELIIAPFCDATNEARAAGSVLVMVGNNAKTYHCAQSSWSAWTPFRETRHQQPPAASPGSRVVNVSNAEL